MFCFVLFFVCLFVWLGFFLNLSAANRHVPPDRPDAIDFIALRYSFILVPAWPFLGNTAAHKHFSVTFTLTMESQYKQKAKPA